MKGERIDVLVSGALGAMGRSTVELLQERGGGFFLRGLLDREESLNIGGERGEISNAMPAMVSRLKNIQSQPDVDFSLDKSVLIDFTSPEATLQLLQEAKEVCPHLKFVIGTTGFHRDEIKQIEAYARQGAVFLSGNFSLSINLLTFLAKKTAKILGQSDIEIVETHHRRKKDAPSGTAKMLFEGVKEGREAYLDEVREGRRERKQPNKKNGNGEVKPFFARHGRDLKRQKNEVGISSVRGGDVVGDHSVFFLQDYDQLELSHRAFSRRLFSQGALEAARYLSHKDKGMYSMEDLVMEYMGE